MNKTLTNGDIYTFRIKRKINKSKKTKIYFPDEVFQFIKDYAGITGITNEQIKVFNTVSVKTLQYIYNEAFNENITLTHNKPAQYTRRIILKSLYSRFNRSNIFENMYNIYINDVRDFWINNCDLTVGDEYRIVSKQKNKRDIFGVITKITKSGLIIRPFAYHYEIIDIIDKTAIKIFHFERVQLLQPIRFNADDSVIGGYIKITNENRSKNYCYRLMTTDIPENEKHLIKYT